MYVKFNKPKQSTEETPHDSCQDPDMPVDQNTEIKAMQYDPTYTNGFSTPLPEIVINEGTLNFRMTARTLWTRYALGMINYSVADLGNLDSAVAVENSMKAAASACGEYFFPYYGVTAGRKVGSLLTVIGINGTKVVDAIDNNQNIDAYKIIWSKQIEELAEYLNDLNPTYWPKDLLKDMFINLTDLWTENFYARKKKDFASSAISLDNIIKVAVSGQLDGPTMTFSSIADRLSKGIIAQFPMLFVEKK